MAPRPLVRYLPLIQLGCMICMIIGMGLWVHYTKEALVQAEYAMEVMGPSVTAPNIGRGNEALIGTSTSYMIFACALYGMGLWRKMLHVEHDISGGDSKRLFYYRLANGAVHFAWWLIMVWIVVLMMGMAVMSSYTWVAYRAINQALDNQAAMAPLYTAWLSGAAGWSVTSAELAAAGGDLLNAVIMQNGWPKAADAYACPSTCINMKMYQFVEVDAAEACVCDSAVLKLASQALRAALDAVPGLMVGIWFMYIFGEAFRTSLACDYTDATRDSETTQSGGQLGGGVAAARAMSGRGYNKL